MTFFKRAMTYLGLGPDDDYDDYDAPTERDPRSSAWRPPYGPDEAPGAIRTIPPRDRSPRDPQGGATASRSASGMGEESAIQIRESRKAAGSAVRPVPAGSSSKPHAVTPRQFDQAQEVADKYKEGQPVIVNLQNIDKDLSRRLIDFSSGLCYGLNGSIERVAQGVYLLTPSGVSVSPEDRRPASDANASG